MSRRRITDEDIRKLSRIGNHSLGVTLPISAVRALKWKEKQKVVVRRQGQAILITDWPKKQ